jgi:hypothetical protein
VILRSFEDLGKPVGRQSRDKVYPGYRQAFHGIFRDVAFVKDERALGGFAGDLGIPIH